MFYSVVPGENMGYRGPLGLSAKELYTLQAKRAYLAIDKHVLAQLMGPSDILLRDHLSAIHKWPARACIQFEKLSRCQVKLRGRAFKLLGVNWNCNAYFIPSHFERRERLHFQKNGKAIEWHNSSGCRPKLCRNRSREPAKGYTILFTILNDTGLVG